jgi:hypothetical protein
VAMPLGNVCCHEERNVFWLQHNIS